MAIDKPNPCGGETVVITANGGTIDSKYVWKIDGLIQSGNTKTLNYVSEKKTADYQSKITLEMSNYDPCYPTDFVTSEQTITVKNYPPPTITLITDKPSPCGGDKIAFTANGAINSSNYQWKVDGVNQGADSKIFDYISVNKTGDFTVKISVEVSNFDLYSPISQLTAIQDVVFKDCSKPIPPVNTNNRILIPNAFSPNSNGMNDTWELFSLVGNNDIIVEIYNRWGELIFYSKGYSEPWNGIYKDKPVMDGTYAYIVRVDNDTVLRGTILVVR